MAKITDQIDFLTHFSSPVNLSKRCSRRLIQMGQYTEFRVILTCFDWNFEFIAWFRFSRSSQKSIVIGKSQVKSSPIVVLSSEVGADTSDRFQTMLNFVQVNWLPPPTTALLTWIPRRFTTWRKPRPRHGVYPRTAVFSAWEDLENLEPWCLL